MVTNILTLARGFVEIGLVDSNEDASAILLVEIGNAWARLVAMAEWVLLRVAASKCLIVGVNASNPRG